MVCFHLVSAIRAGAGAGTALNGLVRCNAGFVAHGFTELVTVHLFRWIFSIICVFLFESLH